MYEKQENETMKKRILALALAALMLLSLCACGPKNEIGRAHV